MDVGQQDRTKDVRLVTIEEAGKMLSMSRASIYALMDGGKLSWCKIGRARRIPVDAIDRLVQSTLSNAS